MIHLAFLVGQLACAISAGLVDHIGRLYLHVARLASLIQEESFQRTLEACHLAYV